MRRNRGAGASILITGLKAVAVLVVIAALTFGFLIAYGQIVDTKDTPEFQKAGDLRFEVANDWENPGEADGYSKSEIESRIVEYTNEERRSEGLNELSEGDLFLSEARSHSADMANNGYVGHVNSEGQNTSERLETGKCTGQIGENAGITYYEVPVERDRTGETVTNENEDEIAKSLVDGWMASPPHKENILREEYDSISVGVYVSEGYTVFATQVFCGEN